MDSRDQDQGFLETRPYAGEWSTSGRAWQDSGPAAEQRRRAFRPAPPSQQRNVSRVLFSSSQGSATAETMLEDAWREQALSGGSSPKKTRQAPQRFQGMALSKFGVSLSSAERFAEQVSGSVMPVRRKEEREGRSMDVADMGFQPTAKTDSMGNTRMIYAPVSVPYYRVAGPEAASEKDSSRPTIERVDETNANAAKQLFFKEDGSVVEDQIFLMQLPAVLPDMLHEEEAPQESEDMVHNGTLGRLPDGHLGKLRIHKSGKVRMELGGVMFDVNEGCETFFQQDIACICPNASEIFQLGRVNKRMVLTPDLDSLMADLPEEPSGMHEASGSTPSQASQGQQRARDDEERIPLHPAVGMSHVGSTTHAAHVPMSSSQGIARPQGQSSRRSSQKSPARRHSRGARG